LLIIVLKKIGFCASKVVVVSGATGSIGSIIVLLALHLGASKVYAIGRNEKILNKIKAIDENRVEILNMKESSLNFGNHFADIYIDAIGNVRTPKITKAALLTLKPKGKAVFVGGIKTNIPINYEWLLLSEITLHGSFMYDNDIPNEAIKIINSGALNFTFDKYSLKGAIDKGFDLHKTIKSPFKHAVVSLEQSI